MQTFLLPFSLKLTIDVALVEPRLILSSFVQKIPSGSDHSPLAGKTLSTIRSSLELTGNSPENRRLIKVWLNGQGGDK